MEKLSEHLRHIAAAETPAELERVTQAGWKEFPRRASSDKIARAMRARGYEICAKSPHAPLVPVMGKRRRLTVCGETYSVGFGQNGAGERYVWHYAKEWLKEKLLAAGLKETVADDVISWWNSGFPHRALASIEMGGWRTDFASKGGANA